MVVRSHCVAHRSAGSERKGRCTLRHREVEFGGLARPCCHRSGSRAPKPRTAGCATVLPNHYGTPPAVGQGTTTAESSGAEDTGKFVGHLDLADDAAHQLWEPALEHRPTGPRGESAAGRSMDQPAPGAEPPRQQHSSEDLVPHAGDTSHTRGRRRNLARRHPAGGRPRSRRLPDQLRATSQSVRGAGRIHRARTLGRNPWEVGAPAPSAIARAPCQPRVMP